MPLNIIISQFWRILIAAIEDIIMNKIRPGVQKKIKDFPDPDLELYTLGLGMKALKFEIIKVHKGADNLTVDFVLAFASEAMVDLGRVKTGVIPGVPVRMDMFFVTVKVRVCLAGMMQEIPFSKALASHFLRYPGSPGTLVAWEKLSILLALTI